MTFPFPCICRMVLHFIVRKRGFPVQAATQVQSMTHCDPVHYHLDSMKPCCLNGGKWGAVPGRFYPQTETQSWDCLPPAVRLLTKHEGPGEKGLSTAGGAQKLLSGSRGVLGVGDGGGGGTGSNPRNTAMGQGW